MYESVCRICNPVSSQKEGKHRVVVYIGETSHTIHERSMEHVSDARFFSSKSHILKHWMSVHPELNSPPDMAFKVTAMFKDCLSRQVAEALRINYSKDEILNSKGEYMGNSIIRLVVEEESWERKKRAREDDEQEMMAKKRVEEFMRLKSSIQEEGRSRQEQKTAMRSMPALRCL